MGNVGQSKRKVPIVDNGPVIRRLLRVAPLQTD
jgi:hypothetical protein